MSHSWDFTNLAPIDPDPIFAITAEAIAAGPSAINGTIGVFMDEDGKVAMFSSVKKALDDLKNTLSDVSYSYPALTGIPEFRSSIEKLIFGESQTVPSIATTAGTGALAFNLRLASLMQPNATVILSTPAWANHLPICAANHLHVTEVPYCDAQGKVTIDPIIEAAKKATKPVILLLQVGCHNPTGLDFSEDQWKDLADFFADRDCLAILDFAYQGFKDEPEKDAWPIRLFIEKKIPLLVAWSASKNHSIYGLRCGLSAAVVSDSETKKKVEVYYSRISRGMHSASPIFGQRVVATVQQKYQKEWLADLAAARKVLGIKRQKMKELLPESFQSALDGYGMFAMLPLSKEQVLRLKNEQNVYVAVDGRLNIAGIPMKRVEEMCSKMKGIVA
ncbi:MAG: aminotransferase class I/II-fold pyridoxal phosphate-dependent enzyme [Candidatus Peribacteraceae bacterium]|nr:aminotransferase class I/II-fold pyridoxal phosphate-dependent enzyme [Candidatus Peribacteraceae bacterium]